MKMRWCKCGINPRNGRLCGLPYGEDEFHVEEAEVRFAGEMLDVYRPYVKDTAISFEIEPPSLDEFEWRVKAMRDAHYPWLMACVGDRIVGYAYAGPFKGQAAYARSVEVSIYLARDVCRKGYGRRLYQALEAALRTRGFANAYACIAYTDRRDPYLTRASVRFHSALGFRRVGRFTDCAEKFGRLYSMVWMEKRL